MTRSSWQRSVTLIQAWRNWRSFHEKKEPPSRGTGFKGQKPLRDTHESSADRESRLRRKSCGGAAVPSYPGHVITENRRGLVVRKDEAMPTIRSREMSFDPIQGKRRREGSYAGCTGTIAEH